MEQLRVMEKPDWVSWEEIRECIYKAQQTNVKKGFDMAFGHLTAEELKEKIGNGYCFVVLNESNKVVATISLIVSNINFWWHKGEAGYHCYEGVIPEYRGTDAYFDMHAAIIKKEKELGLKVLWADTAEQNKVILKASKKTGWKHVRFTPNRKGCKYYSVIMAKWPKGCPHSDGKIKIMFTLSKILVKAIYKPGRINRFFFWKKQESIR